MRKIEELTDRQREVLTMLWQWKRSKNSIPTQLEIARLMKVTSSTAVKCMLDALERKGYIAIKRFEVRGIELLKEA